MTMRELPVRKWSSIQSLRTLFRSLGRPISSYASLLYQKPSAETCQFPLVTLTAVPSASMSPGSYLPPGKAVS